ncbi:nuclear RNA polymerase D1A isoform X2 [Tasmannia lanceolata]|uniref:nuclear RNA polymerase D1A isoform X2 n=1 Tax=Tasmannia lanceolata TaxID=3420 RepID=UPI0040633009
MDNDTFLEWAVPPGVLTGIKFDILTEMEIEKFSVVAIDEPNAVTDPRLGVPNLSSQCPTCGSSSIKNCGGHFGIIKFPATINHPYFVSEIVHILNKVCPGCKSIRLDTKTKGSGTIPKNRRSENHQPITCKYCVRQSNSIEWYPPLKFKISSKDISGQKKFQIVAEVNGKLPKKFRCRNLNEALAKDYWDFIPKDKDWQQQKCFLDDNQDHTPCRITLLPYQVFSLLKGLDPKFIEKFVSRREVLFLSSFPVTPNCNRVTEMNHMHTNGSRLIFDERTRAYKRLVDLKRLLDESGQQHHNGDETIQCIVANRVLDCLNVSKLCTKKSSSTDPAPSMSGSKWIKDVVLGKRTDYAFRMTVVGDPKIRLGDIGIPYDIAEKLLIAEHVNALNLEKLNTSCNLRLIQKREYYAKIKGGLVSVRCTNKLQIGDILYRPLEDGDLVLVNRPPSVHQHSLIAFSVKVLRLESVISINPLCCAPFLGDFDGDCLHGFVPQSLNCRVELGELVSLNRQLVNGQDGRNLLSLGEDSLTAAHLITGSDVFLNKFQMQQLEMLCPAILEAPSLEACLWTGKQLFSMLFPTCPEFSSILDEVLISKGSVQSPSDGSWLRNTHSSIFSRVLKHCPSEFLEFLFSAQVVLCEWLSMRGLSVSLSDFYLCSDSYSRTKMIDELSCGLQEAEHACHTKQLMVQDGMECLVIHGEVNQNPSYVMGLDLERRCDSHIKSDVLSQVAIGAFKDVCYDLQNVIRRYASKENSMLAMINAGSKGNLLKLVQQCLCLGLQYPPNLLSFRMPYKLSCAMWNQHKAYVDCTQECVERDFPYAVVESSFLDGLNPLECFIHSLSSRGNLFSDNADLPGTLTRKLMFYMRDLYIAYDGTVRNAYGNQLIQFSYGISNDDKSTELFAERTFECDGGQPVGAWSACSISEAAYSALDHPIGKLDTSPLLNLKKVLECGRKESSVDQTVSLFLSKKLRRFTYGFEYGALQVKNHLERVLLSDVVTTVMIFFSQDLSGKQFSPWVSHFHVCKKKLKKRRLTIQSIMEALTRDYNSNRNRRSAILPELQIFSRDCCSADGEDEHSGTFCITVAAKLSKESPMLLDTLRDVLIPLLLGTVVKGFLGFHKVEILWDDQPNALFVKVYRSENCEQGNFWNVVRNACTPIMDLIDWEQSHPDTVYEIFCSHGVDVAWKYFLMTLKSTISEIGKTIHLEHLLTVADCISVTGEFHNLNAKGIKRQRDQMCISSPFMQACFSSPSHHFMKAAKDGSVDDLRGTLDAVAWGNEAPIGTGGPFDILYPTKDFH